MEYSKIISITGLPGLFELVSTKSDGGIVRALDDGSTRFVSSRVHQFSHLESIEVYTVKHNVNLVTILQAMENSKEKLPDEKNATELRKYFEKVYPEIDFDRVYSSDLKKMVKWFAGLKKNGIELKVSEEALEETEEVKEEPAPAPKAAKKTAPEAETTRPAKKEEKKPVAKKATKEEKPEKKEAAKPAKKVEKKAAVKKTTKEEKPKAAAKGKSKKS
jgi:Domain of unknown function (DUF5606)